MYKIFDCSPEATKLIDSFEDKVGTAETTSRLAKYPCKELGIGKCFLVPFDDVNNEQGFRVLMHEKGKKLGKRFTVIKHNDHQLFEVARIV